MLLLFWIMSHADRALRRNWCRARGRGGMFPLCITAPSCSSIPLLFLILCCKHYSYRKGGKLIHWPPYFLIRADLTPNPASFYLQWAGGVRNWEEASNGLDKSGCTKTLKRETKGGMLKVVMKRRMSVCISDVFLCRLWLPEECISNHGACLILLHAQPDGPNPELYMVEISLAFFSVLVFIS